MSIKMNKNGKGYPIGILPQSIIDKVLMLSQNPYTKYVAYGTASPVEIPDITQYRYITVGYVISSQTRFFSLATLPTAVFKNRSINVIYDGKESEITYQNDTHVAISFNSTLQWGIMIILS